jgi:hypothetical protein
VLLHLVTGQVGNLLLDLLHVAHHLVHRVEVVFVILVIGFVDIWIIIVVALRLSCLAFRWGFWLRALVKFRLEAGLSLVRFEAYFLNSERFSSQLGSEDTF